MTLTELSYYSRKSLPFVIIFVLMLLIVFYLFKLIFLYLEMSKPRRIYTNPIFGKIKKIELDKKPDGKNFSYLFDTIEGEPVSASETAKVYFLPPAVTRFGYREKIYLMAKNLGFDESNLRYTLQGKEASFADEKQRLTIDITNFNFSYQYQPAGDEDFFINTRMPLRQEVENRAIDFLKSLGRYPAELAKGKTNLVYLFFDTGGKTLTVVDGPNSANMVEIDFYRPDIDIFPAVSPAYFNSQNYLVMVFQPDDFQVVKAQIKFFDKSEEEFGIYPVKSGAAAWEELKMGKGMIVSRPEEKSSVKINKMFFAYFDPDVYQDYLQPVYVFLGEGNFVGYVPAVTNEYLIK